MKEIKVRITFTEEVLGTMPSDPEVHATYIASKAPDAQTIADEIAAIGVDAEVEKGMTIFPRMEDGTPFFYDYHFKGFMKDTCGALKRVSSYKSAKMKAYKKIIDGLIFVEPRQIPIHFDGDCGDCQRPLRAQTPQGERVALANSETVPAGAYCDITIVLLDESLEDTVYEWLDYGEYRGMGQWRNSGKGRFVYDILD